MPGVRKRNKNRSFPTIWERTGLVARTVFKIAEVVARRLVGSIPTRSRQNCLVTLGLTRTKSAPGLRFSRFNDSIEQIGSVSQHGGRYVRVYVRRDADC